MFSPYLFTIHNIIRKQEKKIEVGHGNFSVPR